MTELDKLHNPYDFANPVSDLNLFVGRVSELEEIKYYLGHAATSPRPINLAILGPRASGKTSVLNMCEFEARNRDFCTVRIDLDEGDAKTQLGFFYKVFDGIFSAVCESGAFEGKTGKTYDTYLDIVNTYMIPEDKTFCPFLFPLQYAKAMGSGNANAQLSDHNYKSDLAKLRDEVSCPIVLLFDEGNVLAKSRIHLEKLRNIFMNTPGFLLVLTGTPELFPVMDDVFSPIVRQFKKIIIGGFKDEEETKDCIRKPLQKLGVKPEEIFDFETYRDIKEIHDVSGGRPYEIQLICHMLFRRVQDKRATKMKLDLSVLEDVRRELETSQDITTRPILTRLRNLEKGQLSALNLLVACDGRATFDQLWAIEYIFNDEKHWTKDSLGYQLQRFIDDGIIETQENILKFAGDEFDKIYTKYFAREQGVAFKALEVPADVFWFIRLLSFLEPIKDLKPLMRVIGTGEDINLENTAERMAKSGLDEDVFVEGPPIVEDLYELMMDYRHKEKMPLVWIKLILPWQNVHTWFYSENPDDNEPIESCLREVAPLRVRANELGGDLITEKKEIPVAPFEILAQKVEKTANEKLRVEFSVHHASQMVNEYIEKRVEEALFHANLSYEYNSDPAPRESNNLGYLFLSRGDWEKAGSLLERAIAGYKEPKEKALPAYNLGVLDAKCGNFENALAKFKLCIEQIENVHKEERLAGCLFIPKVVNEELRFEEVEKPDLLEAAREAKNNVESLLEFKSK